MRTHTHTPSIQPSMSTAQAKASSRDSVPSTSCAYNVSQWLAPGWLRHRHRSNSLQSHAIFMATAWRKWLSTGVADLRARVRVGWMRQWPSLVFARLAAPRLRLRRAMCDHRQPIATSALSQSLTGSLSLTPTSCLHSALVPSAGALEASPTELPATRRLQNPFTPRGLEPHRRIGSAALAQFIAAPTAARPPTPPDAPRARAAPTPTPSRTVRASAGPRPPDPHPVCPSPHSRRRPGSPALAQFIAAPIAARPPDRKSVV